jgi:hypothetical protein
MPVLPLHCFSRPLEPFMVLYSRHCTSTVSSIFLSGISYVLTGGLCCSAAVDMDVFGAFQLCSIGILTAPVTVRLSKTYFNEPGRNIIFLWTGLILAGKFPLRCSVVHLLNLPLRRPFELNNRVLSDRSASMHGQRSFVIQGLRGICLRYDYVWSYLLHWCRPILTYARGRGQ